MRMREGIRQLTREGSGEGGSTTTSGQFALPLVRNAIKKRRNDVGSIPKCGRNRLRFDIASAKFPKSFLTEPPEQQVKEYMFIHPLSAHFQNRIQIQILSIFPALRPEPY